MRVILIGSVRSSSITLLSLIEHDVDVVGVFGLSTEKKSTITDYVDLRESAMQAGFAYYPFKAINKEASLIESLKPDLIFVVGLSQLISRQIIDIPTHGCIGFHPTLLPRGRGRSAVAWLILESEKMGAASFFQISEGVDDGDIISQTPYSISALDDASIVYEKLYAAMKLGIDWICSNLTEEHLIGRTQDHSAATYYGKRSDSDGHIDWSLSAEKILTLIRAASKPHPGAYAFAGNTKCRIWKAKLETTGQFVGAVGSILQVSKNGFLVQCGSGNIEVTDFTSENSWQPRVGDGLQFCAVRKIQALEQEIEQLKRTMGDSS